MSVVGLTFDDLFTRFCVIDSCGQLIEDGRLRSTEPAFRHHFAQMMPSAIVVAYHALAERFIPALADLGHSVFVGGPVPASLLPALRPLAANNAVCSKTVARRATTPSEAGLSFLIDWTAEAGERVISEAWYFAGPVSSSDCLDLTVLRSEPVEAQALAAKLHQCLVTDPGVFARRPEYRRVSAA